MEKDRVYVSDIHAGIDHELRWDGGRQILWVTPEGGTRIPEERNREFVYPGAFTAAGKVYPGWKALCSDWDGSGCLCRDIYGREVFCISELFPCFDSYDYANETRYYRWFFIKEKGKLTRIYYADERNRIQVTEDVRDLENKCLEKMRKEGWIK